MNLEFDMAERARDEPSVSARPGGEGSVGSLDGAGSPPPPASRAMRRPGPPGRVEAGKVAIEWVALAAVVVVVLAAVAATGVADRVGDAVATIVCQAAGIVTDVDCPGLGDVAENEWALDVPCVVSSQRQATSGGLTVSVAKLDGGVVITAEERADGTVAVTALDEAALGAELKVGARGELMLGDLSLGSSAEAGVSASLAGHLGQTHVFDDADEAQRFVDDQQWEKVNRQVIEGAGPPGSGWVADRVRDGYHWVIGREDPDGELESEQAQGGIVLEGEASASAGPLGGGAEAAVEGAINVQRNADGGGKGTLLVDIESGVEAGVPLLARLGANAEGTAAIGFSYDADGELTSLDLSLDVAGADGLELGPDVHDVGEALSSLAAGASTETGQRSMVDLSVDLDDTETREAADDLLGAAAAVDGEGVADAVGDAGHTLLDDTTLGVRTYSESERAYGADGRAKLGPIALGGGVEYATGDSELTGAWYYDGDEGRFVEWASCDAG